MGVAAEVGDAVGAAGVLVAVGDGAGVRVGGAVAVGDGAGVSVESGVEVAGSGKGSDVAVEVGPAVSVGTTVVGVLPLPFLEAAAPIREQPAATSATPRAKQMRITRGTTPFCQETRMILIDFPNNVLEL